jgi:hypothetical protein
LVVLPLATTPVLTNSSDPYPLEVDVTGTQHLTRTGESNAHGRADWSDAKLTCN